MKSFQELVVWQKAHQLTLAVYRETRSYPPEELFGLTSQSRRAASSIPTNIAEGHGRNRDTEFRRFCEIAMGSGSELEYHLILARDLHYLKTETYIDLSTRLTEVQRLLRSFHQKLGARS